MSDKSELERYIRDQYAAFNDADVDRVDIGWGQGFGFRTLRARTDIPAATIRHHTRRFFDAMDRYDISIDEINVAVVDGVGLVWGFHTEDYQRKGHDPETVRVRFSMTLKRDHSGGWRFIMGHRDIQPFGDDGRYLAVNRNSGGRAGPDSAG